MLASASRSVVVADVEHLLDVAAVPRADGPRSQLKPLLLDAPLDGEAVALCWDDLREHLALALRNGQVCFARAATSGLGSKAIESVVSMPAGCTLNDLSLACNVEDGSGWALAACSDGAMRLIDASSTQVPRLVQTFPSHGVAATAAQISRDLKVVVSGSKSGHVLVRQLGNLRSEQVDLGTTSLPSLSVDAEVAISCLRFSPFKDVVAACDAGGNIAAWDTASLRSTCSAKEAHTGAATCLAFSGVNASLLISGGEDGNLQFWDISSGNAKKISGFAMEAPLTSLTYHKDGHVLAAGTRTGNVLLYDLRLLAKRDHKPIDRFTLHQERGGANGVFALAFAPYGANKFAKDVASPLESRRRSNENSPPSLSPLVVERPQPRALVEELGGTGSKPSV